MRRCLAVLLLLCCLVGCAAGESTLAPAIAFRAALVQAGGCRFTAAITVDYGQRVQCFTLACDADGEGTTGITLLEPETVAGVTATVTDGGGRITYDGMALDFGLLANGDLIPAAVPCMLATCWMREYICDAGEHGTGCQVRYRKKIGEKELLLDTFFENGIPFLAEVCYNDSGILKIEISDFAFH